MPTPEEIASEQEKLYESASLRDDLNDAEAKVLLEWGQKQVERMAQKYPDEFEQKTRFLRQLIKNINRFVGQREFNDSNGQQEYMTNVVKYLEPLGYTADVKDLFAALPDNAKDMMANLEAILMTLTPQADTATDPSPEPETSDEDFTSTFSPNTDKTEIIPDIDHILDYKGEIDQNTNEIETEVIPNIQDIVDAAETEYQQSTLEKPDTHSINQAESAEDTGEDSVHDEKE